MTEEKSVSEWFGVSQYISYKYIPWICLYTVSFGFDQARKPEDEA